MPMPENPYKSPEAEGERCRRFALHRLLWPQSFAAAPFVVLSAYHFYSAWWCHLQPIESGYKDHPYVPGYTAVGVAFIGLALVAYVFVAWTLKKFGTPPATH